MCLLHSIETVGHLMLQNNTPLINIHQQHKRFLISQSNSGILCPKLTLGDTLHSSQIKESVKQSGKLNTIMGQRFQLFLQHEDQEKTNFWQRDSYIMFLF